MCEKVDKLIGKLERDVDNAKVDVEKTCVELNRLKMNDFDMFRVARILFRAKKIHLFVLLIIVLLIFYVVLSLSLAVVVTAVYYLVMMFLPKYVALPLSLTVMMFLVSFVQNYRRD